MKTRKLPPPNVLEIWDEPGIPPDLDAEIRELLCVCFPPDVPVFSHTRHWHGTAPDFSLVLRSEARVVAQVGIVVRRIRVGRSRVRIAGIQNLATHPAARGKGYGQQLTMQGMSEAGRRGIPFGLLFCVPQLERFYAALGWKLLPRKAVMRDARDAVVPIPGKNICMGLELGEKPFPSGNIDLLGPDW